LLLAGLPNLLSLPACATTGNHIDTAGGPWTSALSLSSPVSSEISPKTGFIDDHRYFLIPNEIFRYS
jgi:hypothetical protein